VWKHRLTVVRPDNDAGMKEFLKQICLIALLLVAATAPASFAAKTTETLIFIHTDIAGSVIGQSNAAGNVIWREDYRPYGERTVNSSAAAGNRQFFHGKAFDADTGLSYFGARYYDPVVGRFTGADPQGFDEKNLHSFNRYSYGNNNPYKYFDPDGETPFSILLLEAAKQFGVGYAMGIAADAVSQAVAFGHVDWAMAATSNAAMAGAPAGGLARLGLGAAKWLRHVDANSGGAPAEPQGSPLKTASGELEAAANAARAQPHPREITRHANMRLQTRDSAVTPEALETAIARGQRQVSPETGTTTHNLPASQSPTGRGVTVITNPRGGVVSVIDKGTRFEP
jgi:RHS repeat-associated protein